MTIDYFAPEHENTEQMSVSELQAFGITLCTRYSFAHEMSQMLLFARKLAELNIHGLVKRVYYNSKNSMCVFEFYDDIESGSAQESAIYQAAKEFIGQFEWKGEPVLGKLVTG